MGVCPAYLGMSQRKSELGWLWLLRAAMLKIRDVDYCVQQVASHDYTTLRASFRRRRCKAVLMQSLNVEAVRTALRESRQHPLPWRVHELPPAEMRS